MYICGLFSSDDTDRLLPQIDIMNGKSDQPPPRQRLYRDETTTHKWLCRHGSIHNEVSELGPKVAMYVYRRVAIGIRLRFNPREQSATICGGAPGDLHDATSLRNGFSTSQHYHTWSAGTYFDLKESRALNVAAFADTPLGHPKADGEYYVKKIVILFARMRRRSI